MVDGAHALTVSGNGSFGGVVGGQTALTSLGVTGTSALNGGSIATTGGQNYTGAATLGADTIAAGSGAITFGGTVNGAFALTASTSGITTFDSVVGGLAPLTSLAITNGSAVFDANVGAGNLTTQAVDFNKASGQTITTAGSQTYNGAVTLGATSGTLTLDADNDVIFNGNVASTATGITSNLTVNAGRTISVGGSVGYIDPAGLLAFTADWSGGNAANRGSGAGGITEASPTTTVIASYAGSGNASRGITLAVDQAGVQVGNITAGVLLSFGPTATSTASGGTVTVSDGSGSVALGAISAFGSAAVSGAGGAGGSVTITAASIELTGDGFGQTVTPPFGSSITSPASPGIFVQGGAGGSGNGNGGNGGTIALNGAVTLGTPDTARI